MGNSREHGVRAVKRELIWNKSHNCHWCGILMRRALPGQTKQDSDTFTVDHIIPVVAGGSESMSNLVGACHGCNNRRGMSQNPNYYSAQKRVL